MRAAQQDRKVQTAGMHTNFGEGVSSDSNKQVNQHALAPSGLHLERRFGIIHKASDPADHSLWSFVYSRNISSNRSPQHQPSL